MDELKKLKHIGGLVNNILPLVYDESLSYYEVTCKILELINEANIEGMKEDIDYIKNLLEDIDLEELASIINGLFNDDTPNMDGTASAGESSSASRSDHVHPSDTSKANKDLGISSGSANQYVKILTVDSDGKPTSFGSGTPSSVELSNSNPAMNGAVSAGSGTKASRDDHVHPSDTSKLNTTGDGSNVTTAFTVASSRSNIASGEKLSALFGKIAKWFADLGTAAFRAATSSVTSGSSALVESGAVFTELNDKTENNEIAIVITGKRPSMAVTAGQYVIVRGSTISNITDGLYTAVNALSPSTDVTASDLATVSNGGMNHLRDSTAPFTDNLSHIDSLFNIPNGIVNIRIGQLDNNTIGVPSAIASDLSENPWQLQGGWQSNGYYKGIMYTPWNTPYVSVPVIGTRFLIVWCDITRWEFSTLDGTTVWTS